MERVPHLRNNYVLAVYIHALYVHISFKKHSLSEKDFHNDKLY